jgi:DNA-directed RNA polymerase specialized sigma24 family protein
MIDLNAAELKLAEVVAIRIGKRWAAIEVDDLIGHLFLWLCDNAPTVKRWRKEDGGEGKLYVSLRREAAKYCAHESAARINRPINELAYPLDVIERALPFLWEETPVTESRVNPTTEQPLDYSYESGAALTLMADIRGNFYGLPSEMKEVLGWRFRDGLTYEEIGELAGMTKDGAKKRVGRAVRRLAESLGTD